MGNPIAQVYADSLFALGGEAAGSEALRVELETFLGLLRVNPDLKVFLEAPGISLAKKTEVAETVMGGDFSETFRNFIGVVLEKRRVALLAEVQAAMQELSDIAADRIYAKLISAVDLGSARFEQIRSGIARQTGKREVVLTAIIDPTLLGGLIVQYGDTQIDGSIRGRLEKVRHSLQSQGGVI